MIYKLQIIANYDQINKSIQISFNPPVQEWHYISDISILNKIENYTNKYINTPINLNNINYHLTLIKNDLHIFIQSYINSGEIIINGPFSNY